MPQEGFLSGLLGGLAGGFADATWEKHQQDIAQDIQQKQMSLAFIKEAMNSPNFRPEFLPVAFEQIQQIINAKPGTKKGKAQQGGAMGAFTGAMRSRPMPGVAQAEGIPATARQESPEGITSVPGSPGSGLPPLPMTAGMFRSNDELAQEQFNRQKPLLDYKSKIDAENDQRTQERQLAAIAARDQNARFRDEQMRQAKVNLDINKMAAAIQAKFPDMSPDEARQAAGEQIMQVQADKHQRFESQARDIESKVATRKERTATYLRLADSLIANREFSQRAVPLKAVISAASRDMSSAESQVRLLTAKRAGLMQAASGPQKPEMQESINAQLRDLDTQLEAAHQMHSNAVMAVQNAANDIDALAASGSRMGMPPVPTGTQAAGKTLSRKAYDEGVQMYGKEKMDAKLQELRITVKD